MKTYFRSLLILIGCIALATGETKAQSVSSVNLQFSLPNSYDAVVLSPTAEFEFKKHTWHIGPTFLMSYGDQIEQREGFKLSGLYLGYINYVHGKSEKFNLYNAVDFMFQRIKDEQNTRYFDTTTSSFQTFNIEQTDKVFQLFFNLGALWNLSDKLSLNQSIGVGVNGTFRSTTSPFDDFSDAFVEQDWLLKTGISYRLN